VISQIFTLTEAATLMNHFLSTAQGFSQSISGLRQAVLDALPEALFLIDSASGEMRSLNTAAARWAPPELTGAPTLNVTQLLPELNLEKLSDWASSFHLCRAVEPATSIRREVVLHLYPLSEPAPISEPKNQDSKNLSLDHSRLLILGLRSVNSAAGPETTTAQDVFHDAFHDPLTRLANRRLFHRRLERMVERASRSNCCFAVLFVDLDGFKSVNDRFGHTLGDRILISAARRLIDAVRPQDMVARRDGDEFTILLDDLDRPEDAVGVAQRIVDYLQLPLIVEQNKPETTSVEIGASIGIAIAADGSLTAEELIACADAAMYHAKALGGGVFLARDGLRGYRDALPKRKKPLPR
jgi:diguanylate cyclase (GGDEF)-like protein